MGTCPFCDGIISAAAPHDLGEGETGGSCIITHYTCAACGVRIQNIRVEKIGSIQDRWNLDLDGLARPHVPIRPADTGEIFPRHRCTRCASGVLIAAVPGGVDVNLGQHQPTWARVTIQREIQYLCDACRTLYISADDGSTDAGSMHWSVIETEDRHHNGGGGARRCVPLAEAPVRVS